MNPIPEFTETELWTVRTALSERYGKSIELRLTDSELRLNLESTTLTPCPTIFWAEGGVNFIIFKVGASEYRSQFFLPQPRTIRHRARLLRQPGRMCHHSVAGTGGPRTQP